MARFKVGQTVYMGRGDKMRKMVVAKVIDNPLIPIYQYSFEAPHNGFACGEQSIRKTEHGKDLTLRECFKKNADKENASRVNTITSALRETIDFGGFGVANTFSNCDLRFKPDLKLTQWLVNYANGRLMIDVGSGQGHLVRMLKMKSAKAIGIEPNLDHEWWVRWRMTRDGANTDVNEILAQTIQDTKKLIQDIGKDRGMLIFARPKARDFVEVGIENMPEGMEALFITTENEFKAFNYLGKFKDKAVLLSHEGNSEDDEVIYRIVR